MTGTSKPGGIFGRAARAIQTALFAGAAGHSIESDRAIESAEAAAIAPQSTDELINEGLRLRQQHGVAAAVPLFKRAAKLDPNSHLPVLMLGNAATELSDLDGAADYYERARDLAPKSHVIRYNLGLCHLTRGYIDAAIEE